jgi:hypothetical protein
VGTSLVRNVAEFIPEDPSYDPHANSTLYPFLDYSGPFLCSCLPRTIIGGNLNSGNEYTLDSVPLVNVVQNCEMLSTVEVDGTVPMAYTDTSGSCQMIGISFDLTILLLLMVSGSESNLVSLESDQSSIRSGIRIV